MELTAGNRKALFVPVGFAHVFQALADNSEVFYQMSEYYHPECAQGVRWDDVAFQIEWPYDCPIVSKRDQEYPDFSV